MSQLNPMYFNKSNPLDPDNGKPYVETGNLVRRLFVASGFGYIEVASSKGSSLTTDPVLPSKHYGLSLDGKAIARIVEDYVPPTPSYKTTELKITGAPPIIHGTGKSSYKIALRIIFPSKLTFNDFLFYSSNGFKFYDEKGSIFMGALSDSLEIKRIEGGSVYDVKFTLTAVKKSIDDSIADVKFTDLDVGFPLMKITLSQGSLMGGRIDFNYNNGAVVSHIDISAYEDQNFTLNKLQNRLCLSGLNEFFSFGDPPKEGVNTIILKARKDSFISMDTPIVFTTSSPSIVVTSVKDTGEHWAKDSIVNFAHAGLVIQVDKRGNYIYKFRPNDTIKRSEATTFLNRLKKYLERMIRE